MNPRLLALCAASLTFLTACGSDEPPARERVVCSDDQSPLLVRVFNASSQPVEGATITARNLGTGKTVTATTDSNGNTLAVQPEIGSGTIRVSATLGTATSTSAQTTLTCGECACLFEPHTLALVFE